MRIDVTIRFVVAACIGIFCTPVAGWAQSTIDVPKDARWQHARSGLIIPTKVGDLPRTSIADYSQSELNVIVQFENNEAQATLYIYRPHWPNVSAWFERSEKLLVTDKTVARPIPETPTARAFARPGGQVPSGLRRLYTFQHGTYTTSGLAIVPYSGWLLKIRYSSKSPDKEEADMFIDKILIATKFPQTADEGNAVQPIAPCAQPSKWKKTKQIREDMVSAMLSGTTFVAAMEQNTSPPKDTSMFCREPVESDYYTIYRDTTARMKYWMVALDAGLTAQLLEVKPIAGGSKQFWSIVSMDGRHDLSPALASLPQPDQWFSIIMSGQSRATVIIDPDAPPGTKPQTTINITP